MRNARSVARPRAANGRTKGTSSCWEFQFSFRLRVRPCIPKFVPPWHLNLSSVPRLAKFVKLGVLARIGQDARPTGQAGCLCYVLSRMRIELTSAAIRPWRRDDAGALAESANNRSVWLGLRDLMPHPYTLADAEAYLHRIATDESPASFCIEIDRAAAGAIGLKVKEDVHRRTAELGYWLAEPFWGRGVMTVAVLAFVEHSFETLPLDRIFAEVYANNPASVRVLEKAGFEYEGRLRKNVVKDGQTLDSLVYARLRET